MINGGTNGIEDREVKFHKYVSMLQDSGLKTAMFGGQLNAPTLVGEREPEVLSADGQIHRSVDSYLASPTADVQGLAVSTAIKEAAKRSTNGSDDKGANDAINKIAQAASFGGGKTEDLLTQMLQALLAVAKNTSNIGEMAKTDSAQNNQVDTTEHRSNANIFTIGNTDRSEKSRRPEGMSPAMRQVVMGV